MVEGGDRPGGFVRCLPEYLSAWVCSRADPAGAFLQEGQNFRSLFVWQERAPLRRGTNHNPHVLGELGWPPPLALGQVQPGTGQKPPDRIVGFLCQTVSSSPQHIVLKDAGQTQGESLGRGGQTNNWPSFAQAEIAHKDPKGRCASPVKTHSPIDGFSFGIGNIRVGRSNSFAGGTASW